MDSIPGKEKEKKGCGVGACPVNCRVASTLLVSDSSGLVVAPLRATMSRIKCPAFLGRNRDAKLIVPSGELLRP